MTTNNTQGTATPSAGIFHIGARVVVHSLHARPELNGVAGTVVKHDGARIAVALDNDLGQFKVRPGNLKHEEKAAPAASSADEKRTPLVDPTLFVTDTGQFIQPRAVVAVGDARDEEQAVAVEADGSSVHRMSLPSGSWEITLVESDAHRVTVHLRAAKVLAGEVSLEPHKETWQELEGLTCMRAIPVVAPEGLDAFCPDVAASVEGSSLSVKISPITAPVQAELYAEAAGEEEQHSPQAPEAGAAEFMFMHNDEHDKENGDVDSMDAHEERTEARAHKWETMHLSELKNGRLRRSASVGHPMKRSRRAAQAMRRAHSACAERRKTAHCKERSEPTWKTARASHAAQLAM